MIGPAGFMAAPSRPAEPSINDAERELWVANDETLYLDCERWRKRNRGGVRGYIRAHRKEIDAVIRRVIGGSR